MQNKIYTVVMNGTTIRAFTDREKANQWIECLCEEVDENGEYRYLPEEFHTEMLYLED